ncbi:MAG: 50S ribosomal protein L4 [bacterium]
MKIDVYNQNNEQVETIDAPDRIFNVRWNADLVHQALHAQSNNARKPFAHAKDRSEVSGGGRKPWRQKGTGRARQGSNRSPLWSGGGVTHGPRNERSYAVKINKKMRQKALFVVLSRRLQEGEVKVVDSILLENAKTKDIIKFISGFVNNIDTLIIPARENIAAVARAGRNLSKMKGIDPESLNVYDLLKYKNIILDKRAIETIDRHYHATK